jgi:2-(1,2-epoxy-1,2-dihydrophenyl)acetyl-CoA isomerase
MAVLIAREARAEGGYVARITIDNEAKLNTINRVLAVEIVETIKQFEDDSALRLVILTGAGERAFSAGADIHEMAGLSSEELARRSDTRGRISWHIASYTKPLIGAINGLAYGGAALLSSSLDLRIGVERTQFRFLAASYGRVNSTWSLPALVGIPKAKELLYTGRVVPADEAERIGLLNQIVPAAKLIESAVEMGRMIAKNDARMVQGIKRLLHEGMGLDWQGRYDLEDEARATYLAAGHPRDGFKDFLARKPAR